MTEKEYQDEKTLRELYVKKEMTQPEIAEQFGINKSLVSYWMDKHGIETRGNAEAQKVASLKEPVPLEQKDGYLRWVDQTDKQHGSPRESVLVHRLVYVAYHGFDSVRDKVIHHKNEFKMDNRPGNLAVMGCGEHSALHNQKRAERVKA